MRDLKRIEETMPQSEEAKQTGCFSRQEIVDFQPPNKSILISIRDPDSDVPVFPRNWRYISYFAFPDDDSIAESLIKMIYDDCRAFEEYNIFIHCEAGISRSAAVMEFLKRRGWKDVNDHMTFPNAHLLAGLERIDREIEG